MTAGRGHRTLALTVAYRGDAAAGWQRQSTLPSLQGYLETALAKIDGAPVVVRGAGRTDRGVHARIQLAAALVRGDVLPRQWVHGLQNRLPAGVAVTWAGWAPHRFQPRGDCGAKTYTYRFRFSPVADPFADPFALHVADRVDLQGLAAVAESWRGKHDFAAACSTRWDGEGETIRTLSESRFETLGEMGLYTVASRGFLTHQVRILAGTLLAVARGRLTPAAVAAALAARDRKRMGPTAPPHGLTLERLELPDFAWEDGWPTALPPGG